MDLDKAHLIKKLYAGDCSSAELEALFKLVPKLPVKQASKVMEELWNQVQQFPEIEEKLSIEMYANILEGVEQVEVEKAGELTKIRRLSPIRKRSYTKLGIAVAILMILATCTWLWIQFKQPLVYTTAFAEQQEIALPDGSKVKLNANSTLRFNKNWKESMARQVWLEGEAFFEVEKKEESGQKFQVITSDLTVEVLGTTFNVNSRHEQTAVYLEEGEIVLELKYENASKEMMKPGGFLSYSALKKEILSRTDKASRNKHTSWKDGVLIFEGAPLGEVLQKIEEIYGVKFQLIDEDNYQREIRTGLPMKKLETVIPMLERAMSLKIETVDGRYIIR